MINVCILGSTGSIGTQTLDVIRENVDDFNVSVLSCRSNIDVILEQIKEFQPEMVVVYDEEKYIELKDRLDDKSIKVSVGMDGLIEAIHLDAVDYVVNAVVGNIGVIPTYETIKLGKTLGLANKESLVTAGHILMDLAAETGSKIIPIDSEHSAIFQALAGNETNEVKRIILTASGGPFRGKKRDQLLNVKGSDALKHPNWSMGRKISIDSATLMNKGLEVIEAKWLFDLPYDKIDVIVHPQSIIHSMVEYVDSSIIAQMGVHDMRVPIHYALNYPGRKPYNIEPLDFMKYNTLTFEEPDFETFPCLRLAYEAGKVGGSALTVLNAANEELVYKFLEGKIGFYDIPGIIEKELGEHNVISQPTIDQILLIDNEVRKKIMTI